MKSYSNYKDSGVKWLGQIPQHWEVIKTSLVFDRIGSGTTPSTAISEYYDDKGKYWLQTGDLNDGVIEDTKKKVSEKAVKECNLRFYPKDSLVIAMYGATIGKVGKLNIDAATNQACCVLPSSQRMLKDFGYYVFMASRSTLIELSKGGGQPNISQDTIRRHRIPVPPLSEQLSIVSYLDGKVSAMDRLVLLTQQKVEHLKALKQAIIQEAVTRGIPNKNHILKQTNIKWIKQIPQHWEEIRLGRLFTENKKVNSNLACMEAYKFNYGSLVRKDLGIDPKELQDTYSKYTVLKDRDIVINGLNLNYDFVSVRVAQALQKGVITSAYLVLEPRKNICDKYYCWLLKAMDYMKLFHGMGSGIRLTLSYKDLKNQLLPLPPLSEQEEIVAYLDEKTAKIDLLIDKELQQIDHIKDLKQTLIADVVTGKVDVTAKY